MSGKYLVKMEVPVYVHPSATEDEALDIVKKTMARLLAKTELSTYGVHVTIEKGQ
jgi:hypothetical protein